VTSKSFQSHGTLPTSRSVRCGEAIGEIKQGYFGNPVKHFKFYLALQLFVSFRWWGQVRCEFGFKCLSGTMFDLSDRDLRGRLPFRKGFGKRNDGVLQGDEVYLGTGQMSAPKAPRSEIHPPQL
jgi:hypothetical protein